MANLNLAIEGQVVGPNMRAATNEKDDMIDRRWWHRSYNYWSETWASQTNTVAPQDLKKRQSSLAYRSVDT